MLSWSEMTFWWFMLKRYVAHIHGNSPSLLHDKMGAGWQYMYKHCYATNIQINEIHNERWRPAALFLLWFPFDKPFGTPTPTSALCQSKWRVYQRTSTTWHSLNTLSTSAAKIDQSVQTCKRLALIVVILTLSRCCWQAMRSQTCEASTGATGNNSSKDTKITCSSHWSLMSVAALTSYKTGKPDTTEREGCLHVNSASDAKAL